MGATNKINRHVHKILDSLYYKAIGASVTIDESAYKDYLEKLFTTTAWSFSEILLVVIIRMRLGSTFKTFTGLYDCNPMVIYEGTIK